jgi:hypothetical protein
MRKQMEPGDHIAIPRELRWISLYSRLAKITVQHGLNLISPLTNLNSQMIWRLISE